MKVKSIVLPFLLAGASIFSGAALAQTTNGTIPTKNVNKKEFANLAKISLQDAINAALEKSPGKAIEADLDSENGFLVYEVKIVSADKKVKVRVDAGDKSILKVKEEKL